MWRLISSFRERLQPLLERLYPEENIERLLERMALIVSRYDCLRNQCDRKTQPKWDEKSSILITYGDMVVKDNENPLITLKRFLDEYLSTSLSYIHILPFFPYSSDEGFSVIDYRQVDLDLGSWDDIEQFSENFSLMFDLVLNHVSCKSSWYHEYLGQVAPARNYFIEIDPGTDLSQVVRPRTSPLLSKAYTVHGKRFVWTTFSSDQVDLNFANTDLLFEMVDILLGYIAKGARIIRLDAIAYIWKKVGTSCINLSQAHDIVKLLRVIVDNVAPGTILLTETNVPHQENISYFGFGDEAHLVYQFSLPPLLLHTLHSGSANHLRSWAQNLELPPNGCTYLNFTASHDGIGIRPLEGLLSVDEIDHLVEIIENCGGLVSRRATLGGEQPYELNITYFDALQNPKKLDDVDMQINRFLCSQAIMLSLQGLPAIYFHSLTATANNIQGVENSHQNRTINRSRWDDEELRRKLSEKESVMAVVFHRYVSLLQIRQQIVAFHPDTSQEILDLPDSFFGLVRGGSNGELVYCIYNISDKKQKIFLNDLGLASTNSIRVLDLITNEIVSDQIGFSPYQYYWLVVDKTGS